MSDGVDGRTTDQRMTEMETLLAHAEQAIKEQPRGNAGYGRVMTLGYISKLGTKVIVFGKATGVKLVEYQQRLRISRAREMLEFFRKSVDEIAVSIGYEDIGGFRRMFRNLSG